MISLHNILSIAKYERKTLLRSWFFRIFSILSLLVLFGMNFGFIIEGGGGESWAIRSIPSAIPYFNLLILNVAQAIIAVFLASDFLKRDKKLDTTEVIYMRSMTNGEYVIGKTWGNLQVFLVLNVAVVVMALIFNLLSKDAAISWASYGIYLLLISIPTLVYIMGLSFLLMSVIRNQAITFVLILGYIGITLFLVQAKYYYIFDYMAFNIPMLKSDIVGFGNLEAILIHRGIYMSLGIAFIFFTIFLLKRLPQSDSMVFLSLVLTIIFLGAGSYLAYDHISQFKKTENLRNEIVELNNQYVSEPAVLVLSDSISLDHQGETIEAISALQVKNETNAAINKLIFSLNGGLVIKSLKINGKETPFDRKRHLIIAEQNVQLAPGQEANVEISYGGKIDEAYIYLDIDEDERLEKYGKFVLNVDKRYAFLRPDYVLLTNEANWYPEAGVTYSSTDVSWHQSQFVNFNLKVKTKPGLQAVSQGKINETSPGEFTFENNHPLTKISLAVGNYKEKFFEKDSIKFGIWYIEGHDFFANALPEISDTIPDLIGEWLNDLERAYSLDYAFNRLYLVEVPAQFKTFARIWTSNQEMVQPEEIYIPEKAYLFRSADFEGEKKRMDRWRHDSNSMTEEDKEIRLIRQIVENFTEEQQTDFRGGPGGGTMEQSANPFFFFPMLYNFQNNIQSEKWPITNRVFEAYLKSKVADMRSAWMRNMTGVSEDEMANIALQDSTFQEIISDPRQKRIIDNVIKLKGDVLFSMVELKAGQEEFDEFLHDLLEQYQFKNISFEEFDQKIKDQFGVELSPMMNDWFSAKELPGYLFSAVDAVKLKSNDMMKTKVSMKVTNFSDIEGLIKISFRLEGGGRRGFGPPGGDENTIDKLVHLDPHQTKELNYMLDADPRMVMINTMTSQNIPQMIMDGFHDIQEDPKAVPVEGERVAETAVQKELPNEIVIDNEDPQFEVTKTDNTSLLEKWLVKEDEGSRKYSGMNYWRPPINWTAITNSDFYGEYVRSGYYIKSGDGSMKAKWHVPIKNPGYYDLYYYLYKARNFRRGRGDNEKGEYQFIIHSDDGEEEQTLAIQNADEGWNHLGSFYFSSDTALIELTNKSDIRLVFADAVKLVEL